AIASFVLGCSSWWLGFFTGVPAIVLGIWALAEIKDESRKLKGKWLAIVGIILGIVFTLVSLFLIISYALPAWRQGSEAPSIPQMPGPGMPGRGIPPTQ
ncbi:MAG TPA: DUF4190 domain-containing protein, partial [Firmicutes bacterium]|nr:DUF4190 domain-containing protein [Bacillota bacterium]